MTDLFIIGAIFTVLGLILVVTKTTQFLAGYNASRVENKERLATIVGITYTVLGSMMIVCSFIGFEQTELFVIISVGVILIQVIYVNMKLVK